MLKLILYIIKYRLRSIGSRTWPQDIFDDVISYYFTFFSAFYRLHHISIRLYPYSKLCLIWLIYESTLVQIYHHEEHFNIWTGFTFFDYSMLELITTNISSKLFLKMPIGLLNKIVYVQTAHSVALNRFMNKRAHD